MPIWKNSREKIINITDCEKKCCHKQKDDSYLREYKSSFLLVKNYFFILARLRQGGAFKRKEDMHRMAEANRAFAHFRF